MNVETEEELKRVLRESEPEVPVLDHTRLVDALVSPASALAGPANREHDLAELPAQSSSNRMLIGGLSLALSVLVLACAWPVLFPRAPLAEVKHEEGKPVDQLPTLAVDLPEATETNLNPLAALSDEELEQQLAELQEKSIALESELWKRRAPQASERGISPRSPGGIQPSTLAVIEGSEALWLASEFAAVDQRDKYLTTLNTLYPGTAAAKRITGIEP